jgi:hypothetical protein
MPEFGQLFEFGDHLGKVWIGRRDLDTAPNPLVFWQAGGQAALDLVGKALEQSQFPSSGDLSFGPDGSVPTLRPKEVFDRVRRVGAVAAEKHNVRLMAWQGEITGSLGSAWPLGSIGGMLPSTHL